MIGTTPLSPPCKWQAEVLSAALLPALQAEVVRAEEEVNAAKVRVQEANLWPAARAAASREAMSEQQANLYLRVVSAARALAGPMAAICTALAEGGDLPAAEAAKDVLAGRQKVYNAAPR